MEKEKPSKRRNLKIFKYLPKAAAAVSFQNPPFSPSREKRSDNTTKLKAHVGKGYSGPIVSIIPDQARRRSKNETFEETQEPTSPKISCMGQIKNKHKKKITVSKSTKTNNASEDKPVKRHGSKFVRLFSGVKTAAKTKNSDAYSDDDAARRVEVKPAPGLGQMKRFASGRDTFANFDWTSQIAPVESHHREYHSDVERGNSDNEEEYEDDEDDDDVIIPFSAPLTVGGKGVDLQPRKEVNLWKRRTMDPPRPLKLKSAVRSN